MRKAAILAAGPYIIPNVRVDTIGIYTNNTPSGAFRSFGALQTAFATESLLDICAERLGLDPFLIRRGDLNRPDIRPPCALGARFAAAEKREAAE